MIPSSLRRSGFPNHATGMLIQGGTFGRRRLAPSLVRFSALEVLDAKLARSAPLKAPAGRHGIPRPTSPARLSGCRRGGGDRDGRRCRTEFF
jgi:hypothetical protein